MIVVLETTLSWVQATLPTLSVAPRWNPVPVTVTGVPPAVFPAAGATAETVGAPRAPAAESASSTAATSGAAAAEPWPVRGRRGPIPGARGPAGAPSEATPAMSFGRIPTASLRVEAGRVAPAERLRAANRSGFCRSHAV